MKWTSSDIIVLILTATIAIVLIAVVLKSAITGDKISPENAEIVGKLLYAIVALIGVYLGNNMKKQN